MDAAPPYVGARVGALGFRPGLKREPGENPGLPRSGKRERGPRDALAFRAGKRWTLGKRRKPKRSRVRRPANIWRRGDLRSQLDLEASLSSSRPRGRRSVRGLPKGSGAFARMDWLPLSRVST